MSAKRIEVGERLPESDFWFIGADGNTKISSSELFENKKVLIIGVIGAFTPACTTKHLPDYVPYADELLNNGIVDRVICIGCVDPFVMKAWGEYLKVEDKIMMVSDPAGQFTENLGLALDLSSLGLGLRSQRYVLFAEDQKVSVLNVEENFNNVENTSKEHTQSIMDAVHS